MSEKDDIITTRVGEDMLPSVCHFGTKNLFKGVRVQKVKVNQVQSSYHKKSETKPNNPDMVEWFCDSEVTSYINYT